MEDQVNEVIALRAEIERLQARLNEAQAGLRSIRSDTGNVAVASRPGGEAVLAEQALLRSVLEQSAEAIIACDGQGTVIQASRSARELCGCNPLGQHFDSVLQLDHDGSPLSISFALGGRRVTGLEVKLLRPQTLDLLINTSPFPSAREDAGCVITLTDISERKHVEDHLKQTNVALLEERDFSSALLDTVGALVVVLDPRGHIVRFNKACQQITGWSFEEVRDRPFWDIFVPPEEIDSVRRVFDQLSAGQFPNQHRNSWITRGGERRVIAWSNTGIVGADGAVQFIIGAGIDVTERDRIRRERERYLAQLNDLLRVSTGVLAETTVDGLLQKVADAGCALTGARLAVCGHGYHDDVFELGKAVRAADMPPCPPGETFSIKRGGVYELLLKSRNTVRLTDTELRSHPDWWGLPEGHVALKGLMGSSLTDREGHPIGMIAVSHKAEGEFTAEDEMILGQLANLASLGLRHIAARQDATRRAEQMEAVVGSLADPVLIFDRHGVPVQGNQAVRDMFGFDPAAEGDRERQAWLDTASEVFDVCHPDGTPFRRDDLMITRAMRGETVRGERISIVDRQGRQRILFGSAAPVRVGESYEGAVTSWHDVTDLERLLSDVERERRTVSDLAQKLAAERDILRAVMEHTHAQLAYLDPQFNFVMANSAYVSASGHKLDELINHNHFDLFPDAENEGIFERARDTGQTVFFHARPFTFANQPDRGVTYWDWSLVPIADWAGKTQGLVFSLMDVSESIRRIEEREQLLQELTEQKASLQAVLQQMPSGVVVAEAGSGLIVLANEQIARMWGRPVLSVATLEEFDHAFPTLYADGRRYAAEERPLWRSLRTGERVAGEEMQVLRPNSTRGSIVASSVPIRNESGKIVAGVVVLTDITDRKRAEEQLQRWANIFKYGGWGIAVSSADGRSLEMLNPTFAHMHGYTVEDMTGTSLVDIFAPEVRASLPTHWRIANEEGHHTFESIQIRKDGTHFPVLVDLTAIKDKQARVLYRVANVIDLTERKQREAMLRAQEKRLAALEAIVGERERIGRDLHDGVAQVMGYMRFKLHAVGDLLSRDDVAQARESVVELEESARMANADIREAIAGLRISSVLRSGLMATLTEYLNRYSQQWGIEAEIVIEPGAPTSFTPNVSVQLQSIVHEAMSNIRKHAQAQHATVRFAQAGEGALITITDDGQGFDQRRSGGQTYGMGIMRERASLIDADLHIVSRPGEGTRITIQLPKAAVVEEN